MEIFFSPFSLKFKFEEDYSRGFLIRAWDSQYSLYGYGVYQSWPQLGGPSWEQQLQELKKLSFQSEEYKGDPLLERTLFYIQKDLEFKKNNQNPFLNLKSLKSYSLLRSPLYLSNPSFSIKSLGHIKFKMGRDLEKESYFLKKWVSSKNLKIRIDFNAALTASEVFSWLKKESKWLKKYLLYIEDPCPFQFEAWREIKGHFGVELALDIEAKHLFKVAEGEPLELLNPKETCAFDLLIIKPSSQDVKKWVRWCEHFQKPFVLTSYMSHPLEQKISIYEALTYKNHPLFKGAGVLTHEVYEENLYSQEFQVIDENLVFKEEWGWGFSELLEKENWKKVIPHKEGSEEKPLIS